MKKYYLQDGTQYTPQFGDLVRYTTGEIAKFVCGSNDEELIGLSFSSFYQLFIGRFPLSVDREGELFLFDGEQAYKQKENECTEEFFLRVAVEAGVLIRREE
jgi:hypothetical protein